jgi:N4-gp56 family major capsid protein
VANETTTTSVSNQVQDGYDVVASFALRSFPIFDQFATKKAGSLTNPGDAVVFHKWTDIAAQTSALNEVTDVTPVALASSLVTVTPAEYGMTTVTTAKVRHDSMLPGFSADQVNLVAYNMANSLDIVCRTVMEASGTERWVGQSSEAAITATDILTADEVRQEHAAIVAANVMPFGADYAWVIHPHVSYDLKSETGDGAWIAPSQYVNTDKVYNNEVGKFGGFKFIESSRALLSADAGSGTVDTYHNYIFGAENTAKAVSIEPGIVQGPVTDYLNRLVPLGWYGYLGYDTFRAEASRLVLCASSIGANT